MKKILFLFFLFSSNMAFATIACNVRMIGQFNNQTYETHTGYAQTYDQACREAFDHCHESISLGQTYGRYFDAICVNDNSTPTNPNPYPPYPPTRELTCRTDLIDYFGNFIRSFNGKGYSAREACIESDRLCSYMTTGSYGYRCINRGIQNGGSNPPPGRIITETCQANRFDPAGYFIESYTGTYSGPIGTDVRGEACRRAYQICSNYIRGGQFCRL